MGARPSFNKKSLARFTMALIEFFENQSPDHCRSLCFQELGGFVLQFNFFSGALPPILPSLRSAHDRLA
jgi:hypothetical protein